MESTKLKTISGNVPENHIVEVEDLKSNLGKVTKAIGAVHTIRRLGDVTFFIIRTFRSRFQAVFSGEERGIISDIDEGDYIEIEGEVIENNEVQEGIELTVQNVRKISGPSTALPYRLGKKGSSQHGESYSEKVFDLRHIDNRALLRLQESLITAFSSYMESKRSTQIQRSKVADTLIGIEPKMLNGIRDLAYRQSLLPVFGNVYDLGSNKDPRLSCEFSFIQGCDELLEYALSFLKYLIHSLNELNKLELDQLGAVLPDLKAVPCIELSDARGRILQKHNYKPAINGNMVLEERKLLAKEIQDETDSEWVFVMGRPSKSRPIYAKRRDDQNEYTEEFILLYRGHEVMSGGVRIHEYGDQVKAIQDAGVRVSSLSEYLSLHQLGLPPHGGFTVNHELLLKLLLKKEETIKVDRPNDEAMSIKIIDSKDDFSAEGFFYGLHDISPGLLQRLNVEIQTQHDSQVTELLNEARAKEGNVPNNSGLPDELVSILPQFAMSPEDVVFVLDLLPNKKSELLSRTPEKILQFVWSVLGHDHIKAIMKVERLRMLVIKIAQLGVLTDYSQLRFLHEETLDNFETLYSNYSQIHDPEKIIRSVFRGISMNEETTDCTQIAEKKEQIRKYIECGDECVLTSFAPSEKEKAVRIVQKVKSDRGLAFVKFLKRLLASRPNGFATTLHTLTQIAEAGEPSPVGTQDESVLWEALDCWCNGPIFYEIYSKLHHDKNKLKLFIKLIRDNFSTIHSDKSVDGSELNKKFYCLMETFRDDLGPEFYERERDVLPEMIHYFYRPINMDLPTVARHIENTESLEGDILDLGLNFDGLHWQKEPGCYSFEINEKDGHTRVLQIYISKNEASFFTKATAGICTLNDTQLFKRKDHFHINLVDGESQIAVGNVQAYILIVNGVKTLLLRGINPSESYVTMDNATQVFSSIISAANEIAQSSGIEKVALCESTGVWHAHSSRPPIKAILALIYGSSNGETLSSPFCIYNYQGSDKHINKIYTV